MGLWGDKNRPLTPRDGFDHEAWVNDVLEEAGHATLRENIGRLGEVPNPSEDYGAVDAARDMLARLWDHVEDDLWEWYLTVRSNKTHCQQTATYCAGIADMMVRCGRYHPFTPDQWRNIARRERWGREVWER